MTRVHKGAKYKMLLTKRFSLKLVSVVYDYITLVMSFHACVGVCTVRHENAALLQDWFRGLSSSKFCRHQLWPQVCVCV